MPTTHRRHVITETDDISNALDIARRTWPDLADTPGALLRQLIRRNTLMDDHASTAKTRQHAVDATAGALAGVFGPGFLSELREQDWPE
ncbi:hypothetical protein [Mycobacterium sp. AZCC_0083]|uniref:hypothetical protein n=1 Tax=Mycobacterium sp. AZCC_0083 TaxID=2735882 RepID=UPI0016139AA0|nr:hypothetical protein [Mycobacterium sp. AZCC_0083]MBB5167427.1 hypothetical protein [Mycobacterium sp. AZCC_0083]